MKKILLALLLLALPTYAQYLHRANPGEIGFTVSGIAGTGYSNAVCVDSSGADTMFVSVTGTWTATLSFAGTNDNGVTLKQLLAFPVSSGQLGAPVATTTANGDFLLEVSPYRRTCVYATAFTSNASMAVRVDSDPAAYFSTGLDVPNAGFQNDAVTTVVQIKATSGTLYVLSVSNTTAATAYVQVFCLPSASVTLGTTPPNFVVRLKTNAGAGDQRDISFPRGLCSQGTGLSVAGTTTATGLTTAAVSVNASFL